jgi:hypothetical protein
MEHHDRHPAALEDQLVLVYFWLYRLIRQYVNRLYVYPRHCTSAHAIYLCVERGFGRDLILRTMQFAMSKFVAEGYPKVECVVVADDLVLLWDVVRKELPIIDYQEPEPALAVATMLYVSYDPVVLRSALNGRGSRQMWLGKHVAAFERWEYESSPAAKWFDLIVPRLVITDRGLRYVRYGRPWTLTDLEVEFVDAWKGLRRSNAPKSWGRV